jgi:hypothetical protein
MVQSTLINISHGGYLIAKHYINNQTWYASDEACVYEIWKQIKFTYGEIFHIHRIGSKFKITPCKKNELEQILSNGKSWLEYLNK